jgi:hypothetical protein
MNQDRRAIFQLLALGRIDAAQAERLLAALSADREARWAIAGCAVLILLTQIGTIAPSILHMFRLAISAGLPSLHHLLSSIALFFGGLS